MMINAGVNAKNELIKVYVIKDLFGIQVIVSLNAINLALLVSIYTTKTANIEKN